MNTPILPSNTPQSLPDNTDSADPDTVALLLKSQRHALKRTVRRALPDVAASARDRLVKLLEMIGSGMTWNEASKKAHVTWPEVRYWTCRRHPEMQKLWKAIKTDGETARKAIRLGEAHSRAVNGWLEPVYWKGQKVGQVRKFSDRLLELLVKSDDPERFADHQKVEAVGRVLHMHFDIEPTEDQLKGADGVTITQPQDASEPENPENSEETPQCNSD